MVLLWVHGESAGFAGVFLCRLNTDNLLRKPENLLFAEGGRGNKKHTAKAVCFLLVHLQGFEPGTH